MFAGFRRHIRCESVAADADSVANPLQGFRRAVESGHPEVAPVALAEKNAGLNAGCTAEPRAGRVERRQSQVGLRAVQPHDLAAG